jgi:hypothetical protein
VSKAEKLGFHFKKSAFDAPVRSVKLCRFAWTYVQRSFKLWAPIHGQNVRICSVVAVHDNQRASILQAGRVLPLEVNFGECDWVAQQRPKQLRVSQPQPLSSRERVGNEGFSSCARVSASSKQQMRFRDDEKSREQAKAQRGGQLTIHMYVYTYIIRKG